jgi:hypothetical protein
MATTIVTKSGSGAPAASDLVAGELAVDLTNGRLYTEDSGGTVLELGLNPNGNVNVTGTVTADGLTVDGTATIQNATSPSLRFLDTDAANSNFLLYSPDGNNSLRIKAGSTQTDAFSVASSGDISFYEDTGTTPKFFWDASAERLVIGDNTVSPSGDAGDLVVGGSTGSNGITIGSATTGTGSLRFADTGGTGRGIVLYDHSSDFMNFHTAGSERMRIISDGEIRTSNAVIVGRLADRQAQAVGVTDATIVLAGNSNASGAGEEIGKVAFYTQDASGAGHNLAATVKALTNSAIGANADLVFSTKQGAGEGAEALESMRIDASGNVGIGTNSPTELLEVNSTGASAAIEVSAGTASTTTGEAKIVLRSLHSASGTTYSRSEIASVGVAGGDSDLVFRTTSDSSGPQERMRIDDAGNVGIGRSANIDYLLDVQKPADAYIRISSSTTQENAGIILANQNNTKWTIEKDGSAHNLFVKSASVTAMTISQAGDVCIGSTGVIRGSSQTGVSIEAEGRLYLSRGTSTGGFSHLVFYNGNGLVGTVSTSGSATAYNTSSDQRLKENIADADDAGSKIDAIQVRKFDWKADGSHQDYGMVAQELIEVAPEAVHQPQNPEEMMGVDYSKLVPMMLKEIQSLRDRIAALES